MMTNFLRQIKAKKKLNLLSQKDKYKNCYLERLTYLSVHSYLYAILSIWHYLDYICICFLFGCYNHHV